MSRILRSLSCLFCLLIAAPALAVPITYELKSEPGDSTLHEIGVEDPAWIGDLKGTLTLDYDADKDVYHILGSTIWLDGNNYALSITGGHVYGDGIGLFSFVLEDLGGTGAYVLEGNIFFPKDGLNFLTPGALDLEGITKLYDPDAVGTTPIGIHLTASAMPEPSAAIVFTAGAILVGTAIRRQVARR